MSITMYHVKCVLPINTTTNSWGLNDLVQTVRRGSIKLREDANIQLVLNFIWDRLIDPDSNCSQQAHYCMNICQLLPVVQKNLLSTR